METTKMVVISTEIYEEICRFCAEFKGLTIDCEKKLWEEFPEIKAQILSAILSKECQKIIKHRHHVVKHSGENLLKE